MGNEPDRGRKRSNAKKMFFCRNEPKALLRTKDLEVMNAENEPVFEPKRTQIEAERGAKPPFIRLPTGVYGPKKLRPA